MLLYGWKTIFLGCDDEMLGTLDPQLSFVNAILPPDMGF